MSEEKVRYWYSACHKGHGRILHILSAVSISKARSSMGALSAEYLFEQLTERDLCTLTGFAPTTVDAERTVASGSLLMEWRGKVVSIEVVD